MENKNTPGPWATQKTAGHELHGQCVVYSEKTGNDIAVVYNGEQDASLIAAAPDMLSVLTQILSDIDDGVIDHDNGIVIGSLTYSQIKNAVSKALDNQ